MSDDVETGPAVVTIRCLTRQGEVAKYRIRPEALVLGPCEEPEGRQWFLQALDLDRTERRAFAMRDVLAWDGVARGQYSPAMMALLSAVELALEDLDSAADFASAHGNPSLRTMFRKDLDRLADIVSAVRKEMRNHGRRSEMKAL